MTELYNKSHNNRYFSLNNKTTITIKKIISKKDLIRAKALRNRIFREEDNYPKIALRNKHCTNSICFAAFNKNRMIGTINVIVDSPLKLPLDEFVDLDKYRDKKLVEIEKLVVLPCARKMTIAIALMVIAYEYSKLCADRIVIFALKNKKNLNRFYRKIGFRILKDFKFYNIGKANLMILDIQDSIFNKYIDKQKQLSWYISRLSKLIDVSAR